MVVILTTYKSWDDPPLVPPTYRKWWPAGGLPQGRNLPEVAEVFRHLSDGVTTLVVFHGHDGRFRREKSGMVGGMEQNDLGEGYSWRWGDGILALFNKEIQL